MLGLVCNLGTQEAETGGFRVSGQSGLHKAFEASLDYIVHPFLKNTPPHTHLPKKPKSN